MIRYADTSVCPACRRVLPVDPRTCPHCAVPLQHPLTLDLFGTLTRADDLVGQLRALVPATAGAPAPPAPPASPHLPSPAIPSLPPARTGVRASSVPSILLGLGALCLLVAAVTFLAVAWSWLGFGGRTAVLLVLTGATGVGGRLLARRDLRLAAEALTTVCLGLLVLDVLGADRAGWLGPLSAEALSAVVGLVLAATGAGLLAGRAAPAARLAVPQVALALGLFVAARALTALLDTGWVLVVAVLVLSGLVLVGRTRHLLPLAIASGVSACVIWLSLLGLGLVDLDALDTLSHDAVWLGGPGLLLACTALLLLTPIPALRPADQPVALYVAATASLLTALVAVPVLDEGLDAIAVAALVALVVWTGAYVALPAHRELAALLPAALAGAGVAAVLAVLVVEAAVRTFTAGNDLVLSDLAPVLHPALLPASALALLGLALAVSAPARRAWPVLVGGVVALAATATLALFPVPLWTVVAAGSTVGAVLVAEALRCEQGRRPGPAATPLVGATLLVLAALASVPSPLLLCLVLVVVVLLAASALLVGRRPATLLAAGLVLPVSLTLAWWSGADVAALDPALRGLPALLVLGALAVALPRLEVEAAVAVSGLVAAALAVLAADDLAGSLALHLTVAGALVTISSLVHASRRPLAWAGGALLTLATWVRLSDLGVGVTEAYTLPAATALVLIAVYRLAKDPSAATRMLVPGLVLATVPSLLEVVATDPVSLRAGLLGLGCLVLVLLGSRLRWSAPLVVGAAVGTVLVLVEVAPYTAQTPQWVAIGLAGALLLLVGVTWERRVLQVRQAAGYLARLR